MRLEKASYKAIKYACLKFHYAKRLPAQPMVGFSVFNKKDEWCGVVVFNNGIGAIEKPFGIKKGQISELARVALNGKQSLTSRVLSRAIKIFKKQNPLVLLLVSYSDTDYGHKGTIYQATNWYYIKSLKTGDKFIDPKTGKDIHSRSHSTTGYNKQFGALKKVIKTSELIKIKKGLKNKYIYPLNKEMHNFCKSISKKYPK
tara:strand:- start:111 stop:713 length:603 start_codon:yes stop_codon:yes gene_type:complete